jgi:hypothetical protein
MIAPEHHCRRCDPTAYPAAAQLDTPRQHEAHVSARFGDLLYSVSVGGYLERRALEAYAGDQGWVIRYHDTDPDPSHFRLHDCPGVHADGRKQPCEELVLGYVQIESMQQQGSEGVWVADEEIAARLEGVWVGRE